MCCSNPPLLMSGELIDRPTPGALPEGSRYIAEDVDETYELRFGEWAIISPPEVRGSTELQYPITSTSIDWVDAGDLRVTFVAGHRAVRVRLEGDFQVLTGNTPARASLWVNGKVKQELWDFHPYELKWQTMGKGRDLHDLIPGQRYTVVARLVKTRIDGIPGKPSTLIVESI